MSTDRLKTALSIVQELAERGPVASFQAQALRDVLGLVKLQAEGLLTIKRVKLDAYEACAKLCDSRGEDVDVRSDFDSGMQNGYEEAADRIRAAASQLAHAASEAKL